MRDQKVIGALTLIDDLREECDGWMRNIISGIRMAANRAITPPSLLGIDRRMA